MHRKANKASIDKIKHSSTKKMNKIIIAIALVQLSFFVNAQYQTSTNAKGSGYYVNPIFAGDYPDPSILRDGDDYYMVHSSFEYYPGLLIWHSKDLINWSPVANALQTYLGSVWAPDLVKHKKKYYIYFPANNKIHVVWANSMEGPWSDPVDLYYSIAGTKWNKIENSLDISGFHHNTFGGFLAVRIGLCSIGDGTVKFKNFRYQQIK
jgi:beta-xylosidase